MSRHAEIAGGGIGGLSLATMLARSGWSVRVHERGAAIREAGTGIFLKNNMVEVLEEVGIFDDLRSTSLHLENSITRSHEGTVTGTRPLAGSARLYATARQNVIQSLYGHAVASGVEVVLGSPVAGADPAGALLLAGGERLEADLVVGTDGVNSKVAAAVGGVRTVRKLPTVINRYMLQTREIAETPDMVEHWSGRYRVATAPCGEDLTYAFQVYPEADAAAAAAPTDMTAWQRAFPRLHPLFDLMSEQQPIRSNYLVVQASSWHRGRVAILGDAAHGMPPTLGQGAGMTVLNARALVAVLARAESVESALPLWEGAVRNIADTTQRWAMRYDLVTRSWPRPLRFLRPGALWAMRSVPQVSSRMFIADRGLRSTTLEVEPFPTA
ncbi:NAD(P)/FAD-dependent oxidoreductase [Nocardioides endophyticus]|uniref:NAD(P)/FAD-dependent oxidoreductase n=1 Tax=Nocardioides endophyticus TaxID=1353775 RepID=A0ABP8YTJ4_9ACTN